MSDDDTVKDLVKKAIEASKDRNFQESVELAFNLKDIDLSVPKNRVDMEVLLPNGRGKTAKVCLFGGAELAEKAKNVADTIFRPEDIEELGKDRKRMREIANEHGFFIAEAPLMPSIGKNLGIVLGPRGKMPKPIPPQADPSDMIDSLRNTIHIRSKDRVTFHAPVGSKDMELDELVENVNTIIRRLERQLDKGRNNIKSIYIKTTMGPAVRVR